MDGLNAEQRQSAAAREQSSGARAGGKVNVFFESAAQPIFFIDIEFGKSDEIAMEDVLGFGAHNVSQPTGHAGTEIEAERTEDDGDATGHIFAAVLADAFDDGEGAAVADGEAFAGTASDKELARSGAIEHCVAGEDVAATGSGKAGFNGDGAAGETFADVIVG